MSLKNITIDDLIRDAESFLKKLRNFKKSKKITIRGFSVVESNGYLRAVRSIKGRIYTIHLGKTLNSDIANKKIVDFIEKMPEADREYILQRAAVDDTALSCN